jgi:hypothetical protein
MIQKKVLWGEPELDMREAQRMLKVQTSFKAKAQLRAATTIEPTAAQEGSQPLAAHRAMTAGSPAEA